VALRLLGVALAVAGCSESRCRTLAARICEACRDKAAARAGGDGVPQPTMDMAACIERTAAACEAHQGPPGCPV
jgi:2-keto-4-pentenoate hydratase